MKKGQFLVLCQDSSEEIFKLVSIIGETVAVLIEHVETLSNQVETLKDEIKELKVHLKKTAVTAISRCLQMNLLSRRVGTRKATNKQAVRKGIRAIT